MKPKMQEKHLFEYAVIRIVPRVEREEFVNAGVILYCASQRFLKVLFQVDEKKTHALYQNADTTEIESFLRAWEKICIGGKPGGAIGSLPLASRFRWLTATRSSVVQASKVHPGFCFNPEDKLVSLFKEVVL